MPGISVSASTELLKKLESIGISKSKVFQFGAEMALSGGKEAYEESMAEAKSLRSKVEVKELKIEQLEATIRNIKEELSFVRGKLIEKEGS